jgi:hypothetical protein
MASSEEHTQSLLFSLEMKVNQKCIIPNQNWGLLLQICTKGIKSQLM